MLGGIGVDQDDVTCLSIHTDRVIPRGVPDDNVAVLPVATQRQVTSAAVHADRLVPCSILDGYVAILPVSTQ